MWSSSAMGATARQSALETYPTMASSPCEASWRNSVALWLGPPASSTYWASRGTPRTPPALLISSMVSFAELTVGPPTTAPCPEENVTMAMRMALGHAVYPRLEWGVATTRRPSSAIAETNLDRLTRLQEDL